MYRELQRRQPQPVAVPEAPREDLHQELVILPVLWIQRLYN